MAIEKDGYALTTNKFQVSSVFLFFFFFERIKCRISITKDRCNKQDTLYTKEANNIQAYPSIFYKQQAVCQAKIVTYMFWMCLMKEFDLKLLMVLSSP